MLVLLLVLCSLESSVAVRCLDCVGKDCMGTFCEGDYCLMGIYAARWGTIEWGEARVVKGCMSGRMLEHNIRSHCETESEHGQMFTCFCDKDYCNSDKAVQSLEQVPVPMVTCLCKGAHCNSNTCVGELCSYVINHRTKQTEQGCVNASVPLIERRSAGACMIPPITGAMHHTVSKDPHSLLATESCVCADDFCNSQKPEITTPERMKCHTFVALQAMGNKVISRNLTCTGQFCFKASITSKLGHMTEYNTMGCASFIDGAELAEELQPVGCAKFSSESVQVETCFQTKDKSAIGRARANQELSDSNNKQYTTRIPPRVDVDYEAEYEDSTTTQPPLSTTHITTTEEIEEQSVEDSDDKDSSSEEQEETTTTMFIFEGPTEAATPEDSNATLVAVFLLLIILILMSGVIWKFELHKRLFRANYDTVAGG